MNSSSPSLQCSACKHYFHKKNKCSNMKPSEINQALYNSFEWICLNCLNEIFPFSSLDQTEFLKNFALEIQTMVPSPTSKSKCGSCFKKINKHVYIYCHSCKQFYHLYHYSVKSKDLPLPHDWTCNKCSINQLPFSELNDDSFLLTLNGLTNDLTKALSNLPSFSIKSLIDKLPGQKISTDDFLSNSIESKYYTPA